ncbi:hypothetical protein BB558_000848 [Smittium angustum]|uniref:mitochondrial intermediate peptidase n=1 Tax=Smittium angustum TaxID=133377 RepID=A0A2U1JD41_SMIAN|nr:hypothetical protein BB558_000848 [Smittium angustum]
MYYNVYRNSLSVSRINLLSRSISTPLTKIQTIKRCLSYKPEGLYNFLAQEPGEKNNEYSLRLKFDAPKTINIRQTGLFGFKGDSTGLFMDPRFKSTTSFEKSVDQAIYQGNNLVNLILNANTTQEKLLVIKMFDQLSDVLCQIMDAAEVIRQTHPDPTWKNSAEIVYSKMLDYMNQLNTHVGIYKKISSVMNDKYILSMLDGVERHVGELFVYDFEKSGIHLGKNEHSTFMTLNSDINDLGRSFMSLQTQSSWDILDVGYIETTLDELLNLDNLAIKTILQQSKMVKRNGKDILKLKLSEFTAQSILRDCKNESLRKQVYIALNKGSGQSTKTLEAILTKRYQLASLVGFDSFSSLALRDKMAKTPENVEAFLQSLSLQEKTSWENITQVLLKEMDNLQNDGGTRLENQTGKLELWNRDYLISEIQNKNAIVSPLKSFFSLGRVIMGISRLLNNLYGIHLEIAEPSLGEVWDPLVEKIEAKDEHGNILGVIYCDLFERYGKSPVGAAHFTVRCSRRIDNDLDSNSSQPTPSTCIRGEKQYQLPIVVLLCNFNKHDNQPAFLSFHEVETLFHEMGHAVHSMLGRTDFHNVSGTRCPIDFVELPSTLMESFASSLDVLNLFARNYNTGELLSENKLRAHLEARKRVNPIDTNVQLFMSALDLRLHGIIGEKNEPGWSTNVLSKLHSHENYGSPTNTIFPYVEGTHWHTRFTHLLGYGSSYYSYLFDRVLSGIIYKKLFLKNIGQTNGGIGHSTLLQPVSNSVGSSVRKANSAPANTFFGDGFRMAGESYRKEILSWGGGRDPWISLAKLLDNSEYGLNYKQVELLSTGSKEAMDLVGSWGLKSN